MPSSPKLGEAPDTFNAWNAFERHAFATVPSGWHGRAAVRTSSLVEDGSVGNLWKWPVDDNEQFKFRAIQI